MSDTTNINGKPASLPRRAPTRRTRCSADTSCSHGLFTIRGLLFRSFLLRAVVTCGLIEVFGGADELVYWQLAILVQGDELDVAEYGAVYDVYEVRTDAQYMWYRIGDDMWIADSEGEWVTFTPSN